MQRLALSPAEKTRVERNIVRLQTALDGAAKTLRWRLRSLAGEALPWSDVVDDRDGQRIGLRERLPADADDGG